MQHRSCAPARFTTLAASACVLAASVFAPGGSASADLLIENVTVIDGRGGAALEGASVRVRGARIDRVADHALEAEGATRIDGAGRFLIPGMIDTHVHLRGADWSAESGGKVDRKGGLAALASYLYAGVTSIYDAGNAPDYILGLRSEERVGKILSPRIYATGGLVTYPGSHGASPLATLVDDWPEAIPALEAHAAKAPDIVKFTYEERGWGARPLIPILPLDLLQHLVEFYNDRGIRTTVHTSSELRAREAIFAGVDTLAHPVIQGPITKDFARLMGAKKIPMSTTLTIGEGYARLAEHPEFLDQPLYRASLSAKEIETLKTEARKEYQERPWTWWMKIMTPIAQENLRQIHAAGGVLSTGTDQTLGPALHREMELLVAGGIAPADVIRIATYNGAVFLGREDDLGSIEAGKLADMVLLDADPTADIDNAKKIRMVIKGGEIVDPAKLPLAGVRREAD